MQDQYTFENLVGSQDELPTRFHFFQLEEDVEWFMFQFKVRKPKSWFKVLVWDPNGLLRLQFLHGKAPNTVVLHKDASKTSSLTVPGELPTGKWTIEVICAELKADVLYKIELEIGTEALPEEVDNQLLGHQVWLEGNGQSDFAYNGYDWDRVLETANRWYKGDFHTHTLLSDGSLTPEEGMIQAEKMDLDFFVTTEHHVLPTGWVSGAALAIPGVEITSSKGHFNALGPRKWIDWRVSHADGGMESAGGMARILADVKKAGAIRSLNHPMLEPWHWQYKETKLVDFDVIEIWNDPTFPGNPAATEKALLLWNMLWNDGHRLFGIGGSDAHLTPTESYVENGEPSVIGDPGTFVYAKELSANTILAGVKKGHVYVSRGILLNPIVLIADQEYVVGSDVTEAIGKTQSEMIFRVNVTNVPKDSRICWIENGEVVNEQVVQEDGSYETVFAWGSDMYQWCRIEVRKHNGELLAFSNPVFSGKKEPDITTWGELLEKAGFNNHEQN